MCVPCVIYIHTPRLQKLRTGDALGSGQSVWTLDDIVRRRVADPHETRNGNVHANVMKPGDGARISPTGTYC